MATLYKTDGTRSIVKPNNGRDFSLEELKKFVGGYIEIVYLDDSLMVVNEEGKLMGLELNMAATNLYGHYIGVGEYIVGDALVCRQGEIL